MPFDAPPVGGKAGQWPSLFFIDGDGKGDRAKAVSRLDESLRISSELGMRPLMELVLS